MILGKSGLWMPMGTVICYGTLITMFFLLTVLPVAYLVISGEAAGDVPSWKHWRKPDEVIRNQSKEESL